MLRNLKKLREEAGISQKSLAEAIGVSQQSINKYENHNIEPDIETLIQIADHFNTSVDYLIGHTSIRQKIQTTHPYSLSLDEQEIIDGYRVLNETQKNCIRVVVNSYTK